MRLPPARSLLGADGNPRLREQMFDSCVLGVDPGVANVGLAVVARADRKISLVWASTVRTPSDLAGPSRLRRLADEVDAAIGSYAPDAVAIERLAWNRNQVSALQVARATGAVMVVADRAGLAVEEYGPNEVKIAITGAGNADKHQVRDALVRIHGIRDCPVQADAVDAVAIALTHLMGSRMRAAARTGYPDADAIGVAMIAFLEGEVVEKSATHVVLAVAGVGYDVAVPTAVVAGLPPIGGIARIHTRMVVREDSMTLYGFSTTDERELFDQLTGVTGVGPKVALSFLSALRPDAIRRAVVAGDAATLTVVPGVGKKVAQRVVLDLRDKLGGESELVAEGPLADVRDALLQLGLTPVEASEALRGMEVDGKPVEDLLREALQRVGR